ncbi:MAG: ATP-binding protein [Bacteroidetes bacterium]|nr:ATP-binding protein [Bacteroidota bacterium]
MVKDNTHASTAAGSNRITANAICLAQEINWFAAQVNRRLQLHFAAYNSNGKELHMHQHNQAPMEFTPPPDLAADQSVYAELVNYYQLTSAERLLLMLALVPHLQPHLLDVFFSTNKQNGRGYTEFGGIKANRHSGFIPTIETALFILAGNDLSKRFNVYRIFEPDHIFLSHGILVLGKDEQSEMFYNSTISVSEEYIDFFTTGKIRKPQFSTAFPAKLLRTKMDWADLVVDDFTAMQLDELRIWMQHHVQLMSDWGMEKILKPGYKALFYGPPGTGKTLTAALLGKQFNLDVYRVDLSMVISKYIGETEQNLEKVFKKAENKNWILFFDEADALFGKRTNINDAHDKYANQEIAYLLQRLEDYPGMVILASNMRNNVDEAFTRRLQAIIAFTKPQFKERKRLWQMTFSKACTPPPEEDMERIAQQYDLSGGSIVNVVQYASLLALNRGTTTLSVEDVLAGIRKEYHKEGKTL